MSLALRDGHRMTTASVLSCTMCHHVNSLVFGGDANMVLNSLCPLCWSSMRQKVVFPSACAVSSSVNKRKRNERRSGGFSSPLYMELRLICFFAAGSVLKRVSIARDDEATWSATNVDPRCGVSVA